ncbi:MAG: SH3 domain-containing protein [Ruminococcus sp.]|nr:SH3 domain-containing protein [Ruminococcus sp.]
MDNNYQKQNDSVNPEQFPYNIENNNFGPNNINNNNPYLYGQNTNNGNYQQNNMPNNFYNPQNTFQQQPNGFPNNIQQPFNRQYADPPKKKTSAGMYIILIAVIVFFAVIIVAMSTIMKAMVSKNNKNTGNDTRDNITLSENDDERKTENSEKDSEKDDDETPTETVNTTVAETEPVPKVVTVTVIVEVPAEPEPVPVQNYTDIYDSGFYGYIATKKDPLNVRFEPSKNAKVVTSIPKGTSVYVYYTSESDWYYTTYNGKSGFISADYVTAGEEIVLAEPEVHYGIVTTNKDPLNLREEPNSDSKILTTIPKGTGIYFRKTNLAGWYWASYNEKSGYVSSDHITISQPPAHNTLSSTAIIATKSDPLNLRETASKNGKIITTIPKGTTVDVIEYGSEWTYISWGQYSGYASTDYLSFGQ